MQSPNEFIEDYLDALEKNYQTLLQIDLSLVTILPSHVERIKNLLIKCHQLQKISLITNILTPGVAQILAEALTHCKKIKTLIISFNGLGNNNIEKPLTHILANLDNLQELDLGGNKLGNTGIKVLEHTVPTLKKLFLGYNSLDHEGIKILAQILLKFKTLQCLDLSCNNLCSDGINSLASVLLNLKNLQILHLRGTKLEPDGIEVLAKALSLCNTLQELDLSDNNFGVKEVKSLTTALTKCTMLTMLNLTNTAFWEFGVEHLFLNLSLCVNLQALFLSCNNLQFDKIEYLTHLQKLDLLKVLDLSNNNLASIGLTNLAQVLPKLTSLQELSLGCNNLESSKIDELCIALANCFALKKLSIYDSNLDEHAIAKLDNILIYTQIEYLYVGDRDTPKKVIDILDENKKIGQSLKTLLALKLYSRRKARTMSNLPVELFDLIYEEFLMAKKNSYFFSTNPRAILEEDHQIQHNVNFGMQ